MRSKPTQAAIFVGLALGVLGFLLIGLAWNFAAEKDCIQCQLPYLISGGLTGIGLVVVGIGIIVLQTLRRDGLERDVQLDQLTAAVEAVAARLAPPDPYDPAVIGEFRPRPRSASNGEAQAEPAPATGGWEQGS